jgi:hypothetical protein
MKDLAIQQRLQYTISRFIYLECFTIKYTKDKKANNGLIDILYFYALSGDTMKENVPIDSVSYLA